MATSSMVLSRRFTRNLVRGSSRDSSSPNPGEEPVVIFRVQVLSCKDLEATDINGYSNPFVIVSVLGKQFQTPVCKRNLNPVYEPKDATFDFPVYASLVDQLGTLEFVVWDKGFIRNEYLGEYSLPIDQWFKGMAFAFDDPNNKPFFVGLISSRPAATVRGTMQIKVGFVHPPNSTGLPDFGKTYNALMNTVLDPVGADKDHIGVVMLEICGAKDLPKWPNLTHTSWDMDPFVQVSIGNEVKCTQVIRHSLNPVWDQELIFHLREDDLSLPIRLSVFDWDRFGSNELIGWAEIKIVTLVERTAKKDFKTWLYSVDMPTIHEFNLPLTGNIRRVYKATPTITLRASYQPSVALRK
ncbi:C2 domain-containing protein [Lactarius psammicola]|nr:C2 domain-containing protein [Lactarius psammicola]